MHLVLGIVITLGALIAIGLGALLIGLIGGLLWGSSSNKAQITLEWVNLPPATTPIDPNGVDFTVKLSGSYKGTAFNVPDQEVTFSVEKDGIVVKTPADGKKKTDQSGRATCNFTGAAFDSTKIRAKVTLDGEEESIETPATYEVTR